jgi:hypothetical protein
MKKIFIALLVTILTTNCSDFLEQDNRSNVPSEDFYLTQEGFASLTNSAYSSLRAIFNSQQIQLLVAGTDIYAHSKSGGTAMAQYSFTTGDLLIREFYANCFKGIQLANSVIHYGEITENFGQREQFIDEARFIRAWYYFQLVQQFGAVSLNTTMFDYAEMKHPRTDLGTVYQFIIDEFTYLASGTSKLLERNASGVGRANKRAANFFLAKAYLTRGWLDGTNYENQEDNIAQTDDFNKAAQFAMQTINNELPALSLDETFDVNNEDNAEIFWSVQFSSATVENPVDGGSYQQAQFGPYLGGAEKPRNKAIDGSFAPALRLQQLYTRGDARLDQTFMLEFHQSYFDFYSARTTSPIIYYYAPHWASDGDIEIWKNDDPNGLKSNVIISKTIEDGGIAPSNGEPATYKSRRSQDYGVACIKKFDDYSDNSIANRNMACSMHDVVVARLGEAYLIAAEAQLKAGNAAEAASLLNKLRQRPQTIRTGYESEMNVAAANVSIDFILDERARELAGEYVRWTDLKRTHKLVDYATQYNEDGISEVAMKGPDGKYKILRPIPQAAIDLNQDDVKQNPGY